MVIYTASSHGFQTRIGAHLTRTVRGWKNNLDASLNKILSSVSPFRVSLPLIDAKAMNITCTQDDPDRASTHAILDISNALPPDTLPLSTLLTTLPDPQRPGS